MANHLVDLLTFVRIAEAGSLTGAAADLDQSLTAVSRRLQRLETRLGVRLINRTTRKLALTDEGSAFHERAARILEEIVEAEAEVSAGMDRAVGHLRITTTFAFGRRHLARLIWMFERQHPEVSIHLDASDRTVDLLESGFDLAIRFGALADSSLIARALAPNARVLCASPSYLDQRGRPRSISDLEKHDAVLYGAPVQTGWGLADGRRIEMKGALTTNDGELAHVWAIEGAGIVLKAIWEVADDLRQGTLEIVLPDEALPNTPVHAVFPHNRLRAARVRLLLDFLSVRLRQQWTHDILPVLPPGVAAR